VYKPSCIPHKTHPGPYETNKSSDKGETSSLIKHVSREPTLFIVVGGEGFMKGHNKGVVISITRTEIRI
jgi:hypothetical protein